MDSSTLASPSELQGVFQRQRAAFERHRLPSADERRHWLQQLRSLLLREETAIIDAISADFGNRSADETRLAELMPALHGIRYAHRRLRRWMKPERRSVGAAFQPARAHVIYQPLGVVGVMVPWNYPLFLTIGPLTAALAAGNRVMIKMSEHTPETSALMQRLLSDVFPEDLVTVVLGEADVGAAFSRLPFDHLLFTGSTAVGRQVMHAAADHLTPVTLELGGKSPAIISADAPLADAAKRIAMGKMLNAGQTCVAPDYVLVPADRQDAFVEALRQAVTTMYPRLAQNPDYTSIINERQLQRLRDCLSDARDQGARVIPFFDEADDRRVPFTVLLDVHDGMRIMREEIFGPYLPVIPCRDIDEAMQYVNAHPRPLALYYFGYDRREQEHVLQNTHSGGVCMNETVQHAALEDLPFGGVGPSGMGHYHGPEGFKTFSHAKAVLTRQRFNGSALMYPPFGRRLHRVLYKFLLR